MIELRDFTVLWEGEDVTMYHYDFRVVNMKHAEETVQVLGELSKKHTPDSPKCDMWDACTEIQEI